MVYCLGSMILSFLCVSGVILYGVGHAWEAQRSQNVFIQICKRWCECELAQRLLQVRVMTHVKNNSVVEAIAGSTYRYILPRCQQKMDTLTTS